MKQDYDIRFLSNENSQRHNSRRQFASEVRQLFTFGGGQVVEGFFRGNTTFHVQFNNEMLGR